MLSNEHPIVEKISDVGYPMYQIVQSVVSSVHTEGYNCPAGFPLHYLAIRKTTGMFINNLNTRIFGKSIYKKVASSHFY